MRYPLATDNPPPSLFHPHIPPPLALTHIPSRTGEGQCSGKLTQNIFFLNLVFLQGHDEVISLGSIRSSFVWFVHQTVCSLATLFHSFFHL